MRRTFRGLTALTALLALLIGVPFALATSVGRPWSHGVPSVRTTLSAIQAGDISDMTVIKALAVLVWIAWARIVISLVIEVAARSVGHGTPRVVGLGTPQKWAAGLVTAVILLAGTTPRGAMAVPAATPISSALLQIETGEWHPTGPVVARHAGRMQPLTPAAAGLVETGMGDAGLGQAPVASTHVVLRHESFWSIAEEELGDGGRWRDIVDLNSGAVVAPGVVFDGTPARLLPGWVLSIPHANGGVAVTSAPLQPELQSVPQMHTIVVKSGDTLSAIASDELGDAAAWTQIWDTNRGRTFGNRVFDDPNVILPGWQLVIPDPITAGRDPAAGDVTPEIDATLADSPGELPVVDGPPDGASVVETPSVAVPVIAASVVTAPVTAPVIELPVVTVPVVIGMSDGTGPVLAVPTVVTASVDDDANVLPTDDSARDESPASLPTGLGAGVLLASGVVAVVVAKRRRELRRATVHARLHDPSPDATATEAVLRSLGGGDKIARLDIALRAAAAELVVCAPETALLGAIVSVDGRIDLLMSGVVPLAPEPWTSVSDHSWRLAAHVALADLASAARRSNQPCPAIAHLGSTQVDDSGPDGDLFIDLEAIGLLTIEGAPQQATRVLLALAAGVALSPMSEIAHLVEVGLDGVLLGHSLSSSADSLDAALDLAASAIGTTAATTGPTLSTFTLRARHQGGEAWEPAIVFSSSGGSSAEQAGEVARKAADSDADVADVDLIALTHPAGRGLAVVVDRHVEGARWRLVQAAHHWTLEPLGVVVAPVGLAIEELARVRSLLREADRPALYDLDNESPADAEPFAITPAFVDVSWSLMVRLLGPVEVIDRDEVPVEFERSKALELVAWLTQHRDRSTRAGARTALWDLNVRDATFANVVSDARRSLARRVAAVNNEEWIRRTLTEHLPLHEGVTTDADQLRARLDHARRQNPSEAITTLRPGLALVRDMPFSGTNYLWPDTEGITSQLTLLVTGTATLLGTHYLGLGDIEGVFWATGQGLKVLAGHEELIALRMRAHAAKGDLAGVRHEWESYERALNADTWSAGEPASKLVVLRRELLAGSMLVAHVS